MPLSQTEYNQLPELKPPSRRHNALMNSTLTGITRSLTQRRYELIRTGTIVSASSYTTIPYQPYPQWTRNLGYQRRAMAVDASATGNAGWLNNDLKGGSSYPVLTAVLGVAAGLPAGPVGVISGLLWTASSTAISVAQATSDVLARQGDEIWVYEQIGRYTTPGYFGSSVGRSSGVWHAALYILIDPFRDNQRYREKGWVIHEERTELTIP